jgi:hypothetical protein
MNYRLLSHNPSKSVHRPQGRMTPSQSVKQLDAGEERSPDPSSMLAFYVHKPSNLFRTTCTLFPAFDGGEEMDARTR